MSIPRKTIEEERATGMLGQRFEAMWSRPTKVHNESEWKPHQDARPLDPFGQGTPR